MRTLSIVIAVYNEKDNLPQVLDRISRVDIGLEKEIIIVDGCSTDGTRQILEQISSQNIKIILEPQRRGKGAALRTGFANAQGDIILIQDADLEIDPFDYPLLLKPILAGEADVVYGSRFRKGRGSTDLINYLGNRFVTMVANVLFGTQLTDMETCYKVFRPQVIRDMRFSCNGFDFDAEFTASILKRKIKISEVAITYNPRNRNQGKKLHWSVAIPSLLAIIRCRCK